MKKHVIQSKNRNYNECRCECKQIGGWGSCKNDFVRNPSMYDYGCNTACKINEYLDIKNCSCEKCVFGKLVLVCKDEILKATETSLDNEKVTCEKNVKIQTTSLVILCLFLVFMSISCYYYYTRRRNKKGIRIIMFNIKRIV